MEARIRAIQELADEEACAALGEVFFRRWRNPLYFGFLADPHGEATLRGE